MCLNVFCQARSLYGGMQKYFHERKRLEAQTDSMPSEPPQQKPVQQLWIAATLVIL